jgi:DNA-binding beta-propeller fold protein YncE
MATAALLSLLVGCAGSHSARVGHAAAGPIVAGDVSVSTPAALPAPQALVTDETQNRLLVVDLPSGRVVRRLALPMDPEGIAASRSGGVVTVVSSRAGKVTVLDRGTLHTIETFGGFGGPHIAALSPDRKHAFITDDSRGTLTVIRLSDMKVTSTVRVGAGAHHLTVSPDHRRLWVALGESAAEIVILDSSRADHPRVIGSFDPGFTVHDLSFAPGGREVWVSSASGSDVTAFDARDHRVLFRVPVGAGPQHLMFSGRYAYLTSGYGRRIEKVDAASGRVIARATSPYGSFELAVSDGYVVTSSLLRGTLAIFTPGLRLLRVVTLASATREVAVSRP